LSVNKEEWRGKILDALKQVYDPEIPIDIVNLGLIYNLDIDDDGNISMKIGLTAPGCPVVDDLLYTIETVVKETIPEAKTVDVQVDFEKQWTPYQMTEEGRSRFKEIYGYDILEMWVQTYGPPPESQ
jgi:metal-sulfur cluster biosynthetic enzyme